MALARNEWTRELTPDERVQWRQAGMILARPPVTAEGLIEAARRSGILLPLAEQKPQE